MRFVAGKGSFPLSFTVLRLRGSFQVLTFEVMLRLNDKVVFSLGFKGST